MAILTRDAILAASDITVETVPVPEWGGEVLVAGLTGAQRDEYEQSTIKQRGQDVEMNLANMRAKLVSLSVVDENGKRLFSDKDVTALGKKSARALQRVFDVAMRLSGISKEDLDELAKNSESDQSDDSTSA